MKTSFNTIDTITVPDSDIPVCSGTPGGTGCNDRSSVNMGQWNTFNFSSSHTLVNGATYYLLFSASGTYYTFPERHGDPYGFTTSTFFADGHAQYCTSSCSNSSSNWTNWIPSGDGADTTTDLEFYFTLAP